MMTRCSTGICQEKNAVKKWLSGIGVVLVACVLAMPWWVGQRIETRFLRIVANTDRALAAVTVDLARYQRGWVASDAVWTVDAGARRFRLTAAIAHGPLPVTAARSAYRWNPALVHVTGRLLPAAGQAPLARFRYRLGIDQSQRGAVALTPGSVTDIPGRLRWQSAKLTYQLAGQQRPWDVALEAGGVTAAGRGMVLALARLAAEAASAHGQLHGRLQARVRSLALPGVTAGPGRATLTLRGLDASALGRILHHVAQVAGRGPSLRQFAGAVAGVFWVKAPALLAHRPRLELKGLRLEAPSGVLRARGYLTFITADPRVLRNPWLLTRAIDARFEMHLPPPLARALAAVYIRLKAGLPPRANVGARARAWIERRLADGFFVRRDGLLHTTIRYTGGMLTINGVPREVIP